jgi:hypothetical protein
MFFLRKWTVDRLVELSLMLNNAQYGTLYLAPFLRRLGAKVGVRGEISTVSNITQSCSPSKTRPLSLIWPQSVGECTAER